MKSVLCCVQTKRSNLGSNNMISNIDVVCSGRRQSRAIRCLPEHWPALCRRWLLHSPPPPACAHLGLPIPVTRVSIRVSQKTQKFEFWNVTYPSGFHKHPNMPNMHIWVHIWARAIWSSGVSLKRSCKMQFRRVGLRSIGPSSQKLWPNQIFGRFPHCNYNVKLKIACRMSFMGL